jgi:Tfp pilus assembly protein PilF
MLRAVPLAALLPLAACGGVARAPLELADDLPAAVELDAAGRRAVEEHAAAGLAALAAGDHRAARRAATAALALDPRAARARAVLAHCLMADASRDQPPELEAWQSAEGELLRAVRLAPDDALVRRMYGAFLEGDGHASAAADAYERALAAAPGDLDALRAAARARYDLGQDRRAQPLLERLAERDRSGDVLYRLAQCRLRLASAPSTEPDAERRLAARLDEAAATFRAYAEQQPTDANAWLGEAHARFAALRARRDTAAAARDRVLALYDEAAARDAASPEPAFGRGVVLEWAGDAAAARAAYAQALARDARHLPTLLNLAANLAADGQIEDARAYCWRALALDGLSASERRRLERFLEAKAPTRP